MEGGIVCIDILVQLGKLTGLEVRAQVVSISSDDFILLFLLSSLIS
jgi:hypothetical protein